MAIWGASYVGYARHDRIRERFPSTTLDSFNKNWANLIALL
jgi:hypothetical protein